MSVISEKIFGADVKKPFGKLCVWQIMIGHFDILVLSLAKFIIEQEVCGLACTECT